MYSLIQQSVEKIYRYARPEGWPTKGTNSIIRIGARKTKDP